MTGFECCSSGGHSQQHIILYLYLYLYIIIIHHTVSKEKEVLKFFLLFDINIQIILRYCGTVRTVPGYYNTDILDWYDTRV